MQPGNASIDTQNMNARMAELNNMFEQFETSQIHKKESEEIILQRRTSQDHIQALVEYIRGFDAKPNNLLRAAIELKNIFRQHYGFFIENRTEATDSFLNYIKEALVFCYLNPRPNGHKYVPLLLDAIKIIAQYDFIDHWPELLDWLMQSLSGENHQRNQLVFQLLCKITKKYNHESRSDALYTEIIKVVDQTHDKLLYYAQGYSSILTNATVDVENCLKTLHFILKTFHNFISQDLHQLIEDNIANWALILKQLLAGSFDTMIESVHGKSFTPAESQNLRELFFLCKGEAIKITLLASTKYNEDFQEHITTFAEQIWQNCLQFSSNNQKEKSKILLNSIKYFKSFCASEVYFSFFRDNINEILIKLIIPSLAMSDDEFAMFEDESNSFVDALFSRSTLGNKAKEIICDFLQTLVKFHREWVLEAMSQILSEILKSRCFDNIKNEIVFLDIFINVTILSYSELGATSINCPTETIIFVHENLIESFLADFLNNVKSMTDFDAAIPVLCLVCHFCRFISFYKQYMNISKLFGQFSVLLAQTMHIPKPSYVNTLTETLIKFLTLRPFKMNNTLNASVDGLPFYKRYYANPQKITVNFERYGYALNLNDHASSYFMCMEAVIKNYTENMTSVTARSVRLLKIFIERTEGELWTQLKSGLLTVLEESFKGLIQNKIVMNFSVIDEIFEGFGLFIVKAGPEEQKRIEAILLACQNLLNANYIELTSLVIQIYAVYIKKFDIKITQNCPPVFANAFNSCLNLSNYQAEMLGLCVANFQLIQQVVKCDPNVIEGSWNDICLVLVKLHEFYQFRVYFEFLNSFLLYNFSSTKVINMAVHGVTNFLSNAGKEGKNDLFFKQILMKEFTEFICIFTEKFDFVNLLAGAKQEGILEDLLQILIHPDFVSFIAKVSSQPTRNFTILMFCKILFQEEGVFKTYQILPQFTSLLVAVLENIWSRLYNFKSLVNGFDARAHERQAFDSVTNNNYSNIHRMSQLPVESRSYIEEFLIKTALHQGTDKFFLGKFADFMRDNGLEVEKLTGDPKYKKLFNSEQNLN